MLAAAPRASLPSEPDPLFADDSVLDIRIVAPFDQIMTERPDETEIAGILSVNNADGSTSEFDVGIRTRGNYRRQKKICVFAPLRINFRKSQLHETVFDGQDKLKLVTHCDHGTQDYNQAVLKEFLAYRILNVVTDISYRVRLLRVSYVYADDNNAEKVNFAFFIEDDDRLAERIGMEQRKRPTMSLDLLDPQYTNLTSVYQYLIGNLDFSPVRGDDGTGCCHNHALFSADEKTYWAVPYDFDLSGLVDAEHAAPNAKFGQLDVRQRIYRGRCINNDQLPATLDLFLSKRGELESLLASQTELDRSSRRSAKAYLASFYKKIGNKRAVEQFSKECI